MPKIIGMYNALSFSTLSVPPAQEPSDEIKLPTLQEMSAWDLQETVSEITKLADFSWYQETTKPLSPRKVGAVFRSYKDKANEIGVMNYNQIVDAAEEAIANGSDHTLDEYVNSAIAERMRSTSESSLESLDIEGYNTLSEQWKDLPLETSDGSPSRKDLFLALHYYQETRRLESEFSSQHNGRSIASFANSFERYISLANAHELTSMIAPGLNLFSDSPNISASYVSTEIHHFLHGWDLPRGMQIVLDDANSHAHRLDRHVDFSYALRQDPDRAFGFEASSEGLCFLRNVSELAYAPDRSKRQPVLTYLKRHLPEGSNTAATFPILRHLADSDKGARYYAAAAIALFSQDTVDSMTWLRRFEHNDSGDLLRLSSAIHPSGIGRLEELYGIVFKKEFLGELQRKNEERPLSERKHIRTWYAQGEIWDLVREFDPYSEAIEVYTGTTAIIQEIQ